MRIFCIIAGFLLALLGGVWTFLAIAPPHHDGDIGYFFMGPITLIVGLSLFGIPLLWGDDSKQNADINKDH